MASILKLFGNTPRSVLQHLEWLQRKKILGQDALLLAAPPSNYSRSIALEFARLNGLRVELVPLTQDTTEADLKTRRDLVNQSVIFSDQAPVRAALEGRVLVLDGLEKCERNVLPTLNNLLENREMNLDDGRLIVSHSRYKDLLKRNSDEALRRSGIVPTHPDFFVIALSAPIPPYVGRPLDPPLRSRFQVRRLEFPSPGELIDAGIDAEIVKVASAINAANESNPQMFPRMPATHMIHVNRLKGQYPKESLRSLFARGYPWLLDNVLFPHKKSLLRVLPPTEVTTKQTRVDLKTKVVLPLVRRGLMNHLLQDLRMGRDVLICGPSGSGKSLVAKVLAEELGQTNIHVFPLHRDMTSRDLIATRVTHPETGDTMWQPSPLLRAAQQGDWIILDGLEKVDSAILAVARLFQDREIEGMDGKPIEVKPSFRAIALATLNPEEKRGHNTVFNPEILSMFGTHVLSAPRGMDELRIILLAACPKAPAELIDKLLNLHLLLDRKGADSGLGPLSLRSLLRIARRLEAFPEEGSLGPMIKRTMLEPFLPSTQRELCRKLMEEAEIKFVGRKDSHGADNDALISVGEESISIGDVTYPRYPDRSRPDLVPKALFFDVAHHRRLLREMLADLSAGSRHLLLMGNQGVGKNKVADRLLELLNAEREYIQLHRDSTVASITGAPSIKDGRVVWEDSPLVRAAKSGRVLVVDEVDKAPPEVVAVLKSLVEDGEMLIGSGKRLSKVVHSDQDIQIHPDFMIWLLSNRPGYPFHGNDFFKQVGDAFSTHVVDNPDPESEFDLLRSYAPTTDASILRTLAKCFADLRTLAEEAVIVYPYSMREAVNVAKHLERFPEDGLVKALHNVLDFESYQPEVAKTLEKVLQKNGVPFTFDILERKGVGADLGVVQPLPDLRPSGERWKLGRW